MDRAHWPVRVWWAPWRRHCSCGVHQWPCPDAFTRKPPPPAYWLSLRNTKAHWIDEVAPPARNSTPADDAAHPEDPTELLAVDGSPGPAGGLSEDWQRRSRQRRQWPW